MNALAASVRAPRGRAIMGFWTARELIRFLASLVRGTGRSKRLSWLVVVAAVQVAVVRAAARPSGVICSAIPRMFERWWQHKASQRYLEHMRSNSIEFDMLLPHSPRRRLSELSATLPTISEAAHEIEEDKKAQ